MKTVGRSAALLATLTLSLTAWVACVEVAKDEEGETHESPTARKNYRIDLTTSHAHILKDVTLTFSVSDMDQCTDTADLSTCTKVKGLPVMVNYRWLKDTASTMVMPEAGVLEDKNDGTYTWTHQFGGFGSHSVELEFTEAGHHYASSFPVETSKAGGEKYFCDTNGDSTQDYSYQVRWSPSVSAFVTDGQAVQFSVELMRSFNPTVNTEQPWLNSFDHLLPAELDTNAPSISLMAGTGAASTAVDVLTPVYKGKGLYEVSRAFMAADLGGAAMKNFWLKVTFMDDKGCMVHGGETDEVEYRFMVGAAGGHSM